MTSLIEQLEIAKEGTDDLDEAIAIRVGWTRAGEYDELWHDPKIGLAWNEEHVPAFSQSIDAAITLVPDGLFWYVQSPHAYQRTRGEKMMACAFIRGKYGWCDSGKYWAAEAETAPLAMCIAALHAIDALPVALPEENDT